MAPKSNATKKSKDREAHEAERGHDLEKAASVSSQEDDSDGPQADAPEHPQPESDGEDSAPAAGESTNPPLPDEPVPPLPNEPVPDQTAPSDDGWEPVWDNEHQAFYFYNRFTAVTQWENPRVPEGAAVADASQSEQASDPARLHGGYNPAIHGDYDPTAPYALEAKAAEERAAAATAEMQTSLPAQPNEPDYSATGHFNRFTGRWQAADATPENHSDHAKSWRQMHAFFDVDAAATSHDGRSLKAERSSMKLSKAELKAFKEKRRERKEEKRRAWLRD